MTGEVMRSSGTSSSVSSTKNASPVSPTFIENGAMCGSGRLLGRLSVTRLSVARSTRSLPNRTWNGEQARTSSPFYKTRSAPESDEG